MLLIAIANIKEDDDDDEQQAIIRWQQRDRPALLRRIDEQIAESERVQGTDETAE